MFENKECQSISFLGPNNLAILIKFHVFKLWKVLSLVRSKAMISIRVLSHLIASNWIRWSLFLLRFLNKISRSIANSRLNNILRSCMIFLIYSACLQVNWSLAKYFILSKGTILLLILFFLLLISLDNSLLLGLCLFSLILIFVILISTLLSILLL